MLGWGKPQNFLLAFIDELWKTWKIRILVKWNKLLEISSFYTCVPKITFIWGTVAEIRSETEFFVILSHFLPLCPLTTWKIKILKKWQLIGLWFVIQDKVLNFHDWILCYHEPFHKTTKTIGIKNGSVTFK